MLTTIIITENGEGRIAAEAVRALGIVPKSRVEAEITIKDIDPPLPLEIPPDKTLQDILDEYEIKYGMTSEECSRKLENDDIDETLDLLQWMGFYELARRAYSRGENPAEMKFTLVAKASQKRRK
ncbi:hypothetical protein L0244_17805 [bacterium]|nr:hypothetical protein [bacterium]MCI0690467.1 hypothetical protein [candidate division KSB1 bacterium]